MAGTRGRPRKSEARDTRRLIIEASLDIFSQTGYQGATIRQIARAVGIRESSIYAHFAGKAEIMAAIVETFGPTHALQHIRKINPEDLTAHPSESLRQLFDFVIETWSAEGNLKFMRMMLIETLSGNGHMPHGMSDIYENIVKAFVEIFATLVARKLIVEAHPEALTYGFLGPILMMRHQTLLMPAKPDRVLFKQVAERQFVEFARVTGLKSQ
jgi:AcrR family transcriptional regulator